MVNANSRGAPVSNFIVLVILLIFALTPLPLHAGQSGEAFDSYKIRVQGYWFYTNPSGHFQSSNSLDSIDLRKDIGFHSHSTFYGKLDWKFTHKNHLYVVGSSYDQSGQSVLQRTINFEGQTFHVGLTAHSHLSAPVIAPGYQYDITRRQRGHLGLALQVNLINTSANITTAAQVTGDGTHYDAISASASRLVPIPVAGPEFRLYLTNSPRLFVEGNVFGMYLFGYGNFISAGGDLGLSLTRRLSVNAGYQLGSRLVVTDNSAGDRIGADLRQQGAIAGLQLSF
jgi:hypothetical protein